MACTQIEPATPACEYHEAEVTFPPSASQIILPLLSILGWVNLETGVHYKKIPLQIGF